MITSWSAARVTATWSRRASSWRAACVLATRRYAKRQRTWFRHEADVQWREPNADAIAADAHAFLYASRIAKPGVAE